MARVTFTSLVLPARGLDDRRRRGVVHLGVVRQHVGDGQGRHQPDRHPGHCPSEMPHGTALFNLSRQLGGSIGIARKHSQIETFF